MPSQSDMVRLSQRKRNRQRFERVGMGLAPYYTCAPRAAGYDGLGGPFSGDMQSQDLTFVVTLQHDGQPDGVLFQIGSGNEGVVVGFDGGTTMQFLEKTAATAAGTLDLAPSVGNDEFLLSSGIHTYVWTLQKSAASGDTEGFLWIDGTLSAFGSTDSLNDWPYGSWFVGVEGVSAVTGATVSGDLTNATIIGALECFVAERPAVLT